MEVDVFAEACKLSPDKRLELIEVLWESLRSGEMPVTAEETRIPDERIRDLEANPEDEVSWDQVREHLKSRRR